MQTDEGAELLSPLLRGTTHARPAVGRRVAAAMPSVVIGELLALADDGATPLVRYAGPTGLQRHRGAQQRRPARAAHRRIGAC